MRFEREHIIRLFRKYVFCIHYPSIVVFMEISSSQIQINVVPHKQRRSSVRTNTQIIYEAFK